MRDQSPRRPDTGGTWLGVILAGATLAGFLLPACAAKIAAPPAVTTPRFPDFVFPDVPSDLQRSGLVPQQDLAWRWLQVGDLQNAEKVFTAVLKQSESFYPAEAGLGYVQLAGGNFEGALARFSRALQRSPTYAPALVGRGDALLALKHDSEALASFQSALVVDASLDLPRRRVEVLQLRLMQANLANARAAAAAGRSDDAIGAYRQAIAASPQSAFLYRELGSVERKGGNLDSALVHYQEAVDLEPDDASAWREIGEILEGRQDDPAALQAYMQAETIETSPVIQERISRLQARLALARLPAEYRRVPESATLTRGELAALVGVHLEKLLDGMPPRAAVVVTDTRGHWAAPWIFTVTRAGIMDAFPNHTFQPRGIVRRSDLAQTVGQLLDVIGQRNPGLTQQWQSARRQIADVGPGNLNYQAVSLAVASGVVPLLDGGTFQLSRPVSGAEGIAAIEQLEQMVPESQRAP